MSLPEFDAALRRQHNLEHLIGVDEAGRGPLAGPVVVAAVLLPNEHIPELAKANDSKKLSAGARERIFSVIREKASAISVSWSYPKDIDRDNILRATLGAMRRAALRINVEALIIVDGNCTIPDLSRKQTAVIEGDAQSLCVACASIVAKVLRDRWMASMDRRYPLYGFSRHKGYCTREHLEALSRLGPSPIHRLSFAPLALRP